MTQEQGLGSATDTETSIFPLCRIFTSDTLCGPPLVIEGINNMCGTYRQLGNNFSGVYINLG